VKNFRYCELYFVMATNAIGKLRSTQTCRQYPPPVVALNIMSTCTRPGGGKVRSISQNAIIAAHIIASHARSPCRATFKDSTVRAFCLGILASALIISSVAAHAAARAGATLSVSTTVIEACFAPNVPGFGAHSGSTTVKVACSTGGPFNVTLQGNTAGPPHGELSLNSGSYTLHYTGASAAALMVSIEY
jgi:hypothetical protein